MGIVRCASTCSGATSLRLPKELPDISKAGFIDVDSWTADNISAADFYRRYLRTGLPVVRDNAYRRYLRTGLPVACDNAA